MGKCFSGPVVLSEEEKAFKKNMEEKLKRNIPDQHISKIMAAGKAMEKGMAAHGPMFPLKTEGVKAVAALTFWAFDKDGNGQLDKSEFEACMKFSGEQSGQQMTPEMIEEARK